MSYSQYPSSAPEQQPAQPAQKNGRNKIVVIALAAALLVSIAYIIYNESKHTEVVAQMQAQFTNVDSARNELQNDFNDVSKKLDELNGSNLELQGALAEKNAELDSKKAELSKKQKEIASILRKQKITAAEYSKAKAMIAELNGQIQDLLAQVEQLKQENQALTVERDNLVTEKTQIQETLVATETARKHVEDVASTLHASNIAITAINQKSSGKEVTTSTAKRADLMRIS
ncbi:MAG TPA: hypothetical protein VF145_03350, partial [Chitinophagaceae bacterium]